MNVSTHRWAKAPARPMVSTGRAPATSTASTEVGDGEGRSPPLADVTLAMHLAPVANRREHPFARARRTRREVAAVLSALPPLPSFSPPLVIEFTRLGWNLLDPDGLVGAHKSAIDAVAKWLKTDDRDPGIFWHFRQAITREKRMVSDARGGAHRVAAASLRIVVRAWHPADTLDRLRVLPMTNTPDGGIRVGGSEYEPS